MTRLQVFPALQVIDAHIPELLRGLITIKNDKVYKNYQTKQQLHVEDERRHGSWAMCGAALQYASDPFFGFLFRI